MQETTTKTLKHVFSSYYIQTNYKLRKVDHNTEISLREKDLVTMDRLTARVGEQFIFLLFTKTNQVKMVSLFMRMSCCYEQSENFCRQLLSFSNHSTNFTFQNKFSIPSLPETSDVLIILLQQEKTIKLCPRENLIMYLEHENFPLNRIIYPFISFQVFIVSFLFSRSLLIHQIFLASLGTTGMVPILYRN